MNKINQINSLLQSEQIIDEILHKKINTDEDIEPLLDKTKIRFTIYPIEYPQIWNVYKTMESLFWKAEEIDWSTDRSDFETLSSEEKYFIEMILAFFAASDNLVNSNLRERFLQDITITEVQTVYTFQMMMEGIHAEVYSMMLDNIITDPDKKNRMFNAIKTIPSIKKMADWCFRWIESSENFAYRLIGFAITESIFFAGMFAAIFWLKKYRSKGKYFMKGLFKSNEFISRDENLHVHFACLLYGMWKNKLSSTVIYNIFDEAVQISKDFMKDAIKIELIGMNYELMSDYIEYISDRLLINLGYSKKYNKINPFTFMESIGLDKKINFFEQRVTDYQSAHIKSVERKINILDDF